MVAAPLASGAATCGHSEDQGWTFAERLGKMVGTRFAGLATPPIVIQPLPADGAEVAQETPRFMAAASSPPSDERRAASQECEDYGQSKRTTHGQPV